MAVTQRLAGYWTRFFDRYVLALFAVALVSGLFLAEKPLKTIGANQAARLAFVEALVERGETFIDTSIFASTIDKVRYDGHYYSNKPPLLAFLIALPYAVLYHIFDLSFRNSLGLVVYLLSLFTMLPFVCLGLIVVFASLKRSGLSGIKSFLGALTLLFCTQWGVFAFTLNNHLIGGSLLLLSWYLATAKTRSSVDLLFLALVNCLTIGIEIVHGCLFAGILTILLLMKKERKDAAAFVVTTIGGLFVLGFLNVFSHGHFLPINMVEGVFAYAGNVNPRNTVGGLYYPDPFHINLFNITFGHHGMFLYTPALLLLVLPPSLKKISETIGRRDFLALIFLSLSSLFFHGYFVGSYGGGNFGYRFLIPLVCLLYLHLLPQIVTTTAKLRRMILLLSLIVWSLGVFHPWPPGYMGRNYLSDPASVNTVPLIGNLLGLSRYIGIEVPRAFEDWYFGDRGAGYFWYGLFFGSRGDEQAEDEWRNQWLTWRIIDKTLTEKDLGDQISYLEATGRQNQLGRTLRLMEKYGWINQRDLQKFLSQAIERQAWPLVLEIFELMAKEDPENKAILKNIANVRAFLRSREVPPNH